MNEENIEEGTDILDPEMKAAKEAKEKAQEIRSEEMNAAYSDILGAIKEISTKHDMKLYVAGYSTKHDALGIWKSDNITQLDEMGFANLVGGQF